MISFKKYLEEAINIHLSHKRDDFGAYVSGNEDDEKVTNLSSEEITSGFEPADKMEDKDNTKHVDQMVNHLSGGGALPPIYVRKHETGGYQVLDGHHRWTAHKKYGSETIPAIIVDPKRISTDMEKI